jgi:hypothetical protein
MRFVFLFGALAALASAVPHPQDDSLEPTEESETSSLVFPTPTVPLPLTTSLNIPVTPSLELPFPEATTSSRRRPHWEPIPIFTKECKCNIATARYPCWATDALQASQNKMAYTGRMRIAGNTELRRASHEISRAYQPVLQHELMLAQSRNVTTKRFFPMDATWKQPAVARHQREL